MRSVPGKARSRLPVPSWTLSYLLLAGASAATAHADPHLRQSFDMRVPMPPAAVTVAGDSQLTYELHLTNFAPAGLVLERLEVTDANGGGSVLADLDAAELGQRLYRPGAGAGSTDARLIDPGMLGVVYLELTTEPGAVPQVLEHHLTFHPAGEAQESTVLQGARVTIEAERPVVVAAPLRGGPWAAVHDASWPRGHRRYIYAVVGEATIPARFAIDWILLDDQGLPVGGDEDAVDNWLGYGADVFAVADGTVVAARDDVAETALVSEHPDHPIEDATGNYVAVDIGRDRIAFFEHLKPGSVHVQAGDRVRQGQVIGALGFTGQSTGPHLHFHVADRNSPLGAEGVPFVLDEFKLLGHYPEFERFGAGRWKRRSAVIDELRRGERPPSNSVVMFR
jgi:murein DD-endopeptidase